MLPCCREGAQSRGVGGVASVLRIELLQAGQQTLACGR
jgi:hypothetical protein